MRIHIRWFPYSEAVRNSISTPYFRTMPRVFPLAITTVLYRDMFDHVFSRAGAQRDSQAYPDHRSVGWWFLGSDRTHSCASQKLPNGLQHRLPGGSPAGHCSDASETASARWIHSGSADGGLNCKGIGRCGAFAARQAAGHACRHRRWRPGPAQCYGKSGQRLDDCDAAEQPVSGAKVRKYDTSKKLRSRLCPANSFYHISLKVQFLSCYSAWTLGPYPRSPTPYIPNILHPNHII